MRESVVAFVRQADDEWLLVAVPRLVARAISEAGDLAFRPDAWSGTSLRLEGDLVKLGHDILRGRSMELSSEPSLNLL